jgi:2,4-dienoyl-CoA reductase-like NADH-dependent reductase (Old Yellow Enzyme family)
MLRHFATIGKGERELDAAGTPTIATPLRLPCGVLLPNRLCKSAMTEGVGDDWHRATPRHATLYRRWREGGVGLSITGNVMIDREVLERPGNVAIDATDPRTTDAAARARLRDWARAGTGDGSQLWMQVSHAGRQSPRYVTSRTVGPSAVGLALLGNYARPRALSEPEIRDFAARFGHVAAIARDCGFTGVQVHAAHGYLVSAFLSPVTNQRTDDWGGPLERRARFLLEAVRATRAAVGADFPVSVKLNSDDFRKGGFSHADCLEVVRLLGAEGIDLLEISGGTYEQPRLLGRKRDAGAHQHACARGVLHRVCGCDPRRRVDAAAADRRLPLARGDGRRARRRRLRRGRAGAPAGHRAGPAAAAAARRSGVRGGA